MRACSTHASLQWCAPLAPSCGHAPLLHHHPIVFLSSPGCTPPTHTAPPDDPGRNGQKYVFDDFREAYAWLRHNTHPDAKVASW